MLCFTRRFRRAKPRSGAAAVEFALIAPVLIMIVVGSVEIGRTIMVMDVLSHAARSGCRVGVLPGKGNTDVQTAVSTALSSAGIQGADDPVIDTLVQGGSTWSSPGNCGTASSGDSVRVTVSIPYSKVSWLGFYWFMKGNTTLSSNVVMCKE